LLGFRPAGPTPAARGPFSSPPSLLIPGPAQHGQETASATFPPTESLTHRAQLSVPPPPFRSGRSLGHGNRTARAHVPREWERRLCPGLQKECVTPSPPFLSPVPSLSHSFEHLENHRGDPPEHRPPHLVGLRPRAGSTPFVRSVSFASLPSFSPSLSRVGWWPLGPLPRAPASPSTAGHGGCPSGLSPAVFCPVTNSPSPPLSSGALGLAR
jgi:hypothetical protein